MPLLSLLLPIALQAASSVPAPMPRPMRESEPVCVRAGDLPPAFARWNERPTARLTIGAPYVAAGVHPLTLKWPMGGPSARGGKAAVVWFDIRRAGVYRIGLSDGAWIDVVRGHTLQPSVAHEHGPACTGLRKIVDFRLAPGRYALQLAGMRGDSVKAMIVRK